MEERTPPEGAAAASGHGTSDSASNTEGSGESRERERVRHNAEIQGEEGGNDGVRDENIAGSQRPPTATSSSGNAEVEPAPSTSAGTPAAGDQGPNSIEKLWLWF